MPRGKFNATLNKKERNERNGKTKNNIWYSEGTDGMTHSDIKGSKEDSLTEGRGMQKVPPKQEDVKAFAWEQKENMPKVVLNKDISEERFAKKGGNASSHNESVPHHQETTVEMTHSNAKGGGDDSLAQGESTHGIPSNVGAICESSLNEDMFQKLNSINENLNHISLKMDMHHGELKAGLKWDKTVDKMTHSNGKGDEGKESVSQDECIQGALNQTNYYGTVLGKDAVIEELNSMNQILKLILLKTEVHHDELKACLQLDHATDGKAHFDARGENLNALDKNVLEIASNQKFHDEIELKQNEVLSKVDLNKGIPLDVEQFVKNGREGFSYNGRILQMGSYQAATSNMTHSSTKGKRDLLAQSESMHEVSTNQVALAENALKHKKVLPKIDLQRSMSEMTHSDINQNSLAQDETPEEALKQEEVVPEVDLIRGISEEQIVENGGEASSPNEHIPQMGSHLRAMDEMSDSDSKGVEENLMVQGECKHEITSNQKDCDETELKKEEILSKPDLNKDNPEAQFVKNSEASPQNESFSQMEMEMYQEAIDEMTHSDTKGVGEDSLVQDESKHEITSNQNDLDETGLKQEKMLSKINLNSENPELNFVKNEVETSCPNESVPEIGTLEMLGEIGESDIIQHSLDEPQMRSQVDSNIQGKGFLKVTSGSFVFEQRFSSGTRVRFDYNETYSSDQEFPSRKFKYRP